MTDSHIGTNTEEAPEQSMASRGESRSRRPGSDASHEFMGPGWSPRVAKEVERCGAANYLPQRAAKAGEPFAGERLVIPAGTYEVRNNDCTYRFRAHNAFAHLSGLGSERESNLVLVLEPKENGSHGAILYFKLRTSRSTQEFYSDPQYGEFRVGARPSLEEAYQEMDLRCAHINALPDALAKDAGRVELHIVRGVDTSIEAVVNEIREQTGLPFNEEARGTDETFEEHLSEIRLRKDTFELTELARAAEATRADFEDIMRVLPRVVGHRRGGRIVESAFGAVTREEGNGLGYDTIAVSGNHANTLHWIDNNGSINEGDLILAGAGAKVDSPYTADITRTLPANGRLVEVQARVYRAILDTCKAALARANGPGTRFHDVHNTTMFVVATRPYERGLPPVSVGEPLSPAGQQHRCWIPHDTSHHLSLDVHDCAQARRKVYQNTLLGPGMTFTTEPDLYFRADSETIPAEYRGVGVRIEDDIVVNEDRSVTRISEDIPRTIDGIEAWIARARGHRAF